MSGSAAVKSKLELDLARLGPWVTHFDIDGHTTVEIANRTGRTPKAVESLLTRARARLRTCIERRLA